MRDFSKAPNPIRYSKSPHPKADEAWTIPVEAYWWEPGDATRYNFVLVEGLNDYDYLTLIIGGKHWTLNIHKDWRLLSVNLTEAFGFQPSRADGGYDRLLIDTGMRDYERFVISEFLTRVREGKVEVE